MHTLLAALAAIGAVTALATTKPIIESQKHQLAARQYGPAHGTALFCSMPDYSPECAHVGYYNFICQPMPFDLKQVVQSAKVLNPGSDAAKCVFYRNLDCTGGSSPEVPASGLDNFQTHGIYGTWQGFYCWNGTLTGGVGTPETIHSKQEKKALLPLDKRTPQSKPADGFFYYCAGPGFSGACSTTPYYSKECNSVPAGYNGAVQAATPVVNYNAACFVYDEAKCRGEATQALVYPGVRNFQTHGYYGFWKSCYCDCGEACPNR